MGKDQGNDAIIGQIEEMVGLNVPATEKTPPTEEQHPEQTPAPASAEVSEVNTPSAQQSKEQNDALTKEILKIDLEIETLSKQTIDVSDFYSKIEDELSEEEQQLEFNDKPAYLKLVSEKAKAYEAKHSTASSIAELESKKTDLIGVQERRGALAFVSAKYPSVDVDKVFEFFTNKLNKEQQDEINTNSSSYADVYEKTFKKYLESNNINIQQQNAPKLPNVNDVRRQTLDTKQIEDGLNSEEEKLHVALGI